MVILIQIVRDNLMAVVGVAPYLLTIHTPQI